MAASALLRERDRSRDHLLADVPELHGYEDALELRARRKLADGPDLLEEATPSRPADGNEDGEPREEPDRACVAGARVREHREHEDRRGERSPDERGHRKPVTAEQHVRPRAVRTREVGLPHPQTNDGELGRGEGDEDAERVETREEGRVPAGCKLGERDEPDRKSRGDRDRLARDHRAALEPGELARQGSVLRQRVRQARDPRERRRRGAREDEDAGDPDDDLEAVDHERGEGAVEGGGDSHERRLEPLLAERRLAVRHRVGREADRSDQHGDEHDETDRGEERARQRAPRLGRLLGEIRDRLEPRVREHRERQRERKVAPVLAAGEAEPFGERLRREQERQTEDDEHALYEQVEQRDRERRRDEAGSDGSRARPRWPRSARTRSARPRATRAAPPDPPPPAR